MLEKPKKLNIYKHFLGIAVFSLPLFTSAFSISEFFKFLKEGQATNSKSSIIKEESLQSLKVFEPNKVYADTKENVNFTNIVPEKAVAFEVNQDFEDNISENSPENHGENAIYTVQKGESIYSIASYFGVSVDTIVTFNHLPSKTVHPGDVLEVPSVSGVLYEVNKGDTLEALAKKYEIDPEDILLYNGLFSGDKLVVGDDIFLPGAKEKETLKTSNKKIASKAKNVLTKKGKQWANGDTQHLNTQSDIQRYSSLPKFAGYYLFPAPGSIRTQKMHGHNGVDFGGKMGSPVLVAADGIVTVAKTGGYNFGYGNYIKVSHGNGTETIYAHLQKVNVAVGQAVTKGEQIATLGNSGNSTGPHLHFEIRGAYNPFAW